MPVDLDALLARADALAGQGPEGLQPIFRDLAAAVRELRAAAETNVPPGYHHVHHCPAEARAERAEAVMVKWMDAHTQERARAERAEAALAEARGLLELCRDHDDTKWIRKVERFLTRTGDKS